MTTGDAAARNGSTVIVSPSRKCRRCNRQVVVAFCGPCGSAAAIASATGRRGCAAVANGHCSREVCDAELRLIYGSMRLARSARELIPSFG